MFGLGLTLADGALSAPRQRQTEVWLVSARSRAEESLPTAYGLLRAHGQSATRAKRDPAMDGKPHRNETALEEDDAREAFGDKGELTGRRSQENG